MFRFAGVVWLGLTVVACGPVGSEPAPVRDPWSSADAPASPVQALYAPCASCHLADGQGRADGSVPRLAGQLAPVMVHKLDQIASGELDLPAMTPFARSLDGAQREALAGWLASLPDPPAVGHGDGSALERGAKVYAGRCAGCHGLRGEGVAALRSPRLCGQHAGYLLRRMDTAEARPGADPGMLAMLDGLEPSDRAAVADHLSRCTL